MGKAINILILDDSKTRHKILARRFLNHNVVAVYTYNEFVEKLDCQYDLMMLDHDLEEHDNPSSYIDGWKKKQYYTGMHAAMRVCELDDKLKPKQVIIHSLNPAGAKVMQIDLEKASIEVVLEPFNYKDDELK